MRRIFPVLFIASLISCTPAKVSRAPQPPVVSDAASPQQAAQPKQTVAPPQLRNVPEEKIEKTNVRNGVIFAKTDFQGVLEKTYVKLLIEDVTNGENKFHLY